MISAPRITPALTPPARRCIVYLQLVELAVPDEALAALHAGLRPGEIARARRFERGADRRRFIVARHALRQCLAHHLAMPAADVPLVEGARGKLRVAGAPGLHFSLAHSADLAAIVVARGTRVGVDLEAVDTRRDIEAASELALSDAERGAFARLPRRARRGAFHRAWCRKEAFVKALGAGMALSPADYSVTLGTRARLLHIRGAGPGRWSLRDFAPAPGYTGAIAVHAPSFRIERCR